MPTFHLLIKGQVQGVFYRATAKKIADKTGVRGWIKNTPEDEVEAIITGTDEQLQQFISWCRQGPALAKVTDVITEEFKETEFKSFSIIR